ncbi:MAG TPA: amidohydrolase family protein [Candidatus Acidoferrales bacterium]|nr:amidohydrolase family protein [Candidatus Acidoferrales bacterium]
MRAKAVVPVSAAPLEDGAIFVVGQKIRAVRPWKDLRPHLREKVFDLGSVALLPGLVNSHCHLDFTDMAGELPPPKTFTDWIAAIMAAKSAWGYSDYARSWLQGAHQLVRSGVTTVGDVESMPDLLPEVWDATPLRVFSFLEMTGITLRRAPKEILRDAAGLIESLRHARNRAWLSPHAPYSTRPELLERTARMAKRRNWRVSIHVAESQEEFDMFLRAEGAMHEWLSRNGRDVADCGLGSPVAHLARHRLLGANVLAIHVNCLGRGDATLLAKNKTSVVHCPRSHDYFRHPTFQRSRLAEAGVNICLGTDSLATVRPTGKRGPVLDMFAEMRALASRERGLSPAEVLKMATVNGAWALGLGGSIGELTPGAFADVIALPFSGRISDLHDAALAHTGGVSASLIEGRWAIPPK